MTEEIAEWRRDAHTAGAGLFGAAQQPTFRLDDELRSSLVSKYDIGWSIREPLSPYPNQTLWRGRSSPPHIALMQSDLTNSEAEALAQDFAGLIESAVSNVAANPNAADNLVEAPAGARARVALPPRPPSKGQYRRRG